MVQLSSGGQYRKQIKRLLSAGSVTSGSTTVSTIINAPHWHTAKCTVRITATTSDHVYTVRGLTGPSTSLGQILATSTGGVSIVLSATATADATARISYSGLDQFFAVSVVSSGGTGATTGLDIDAELF
jgi:hypothetical protein